MPDNLSPEDRKKTMRAVKSRMTGHEKKFQALLQDNNIQGWSMHLGDIPGNPDFVFPDIKTAFFIDGCFWHGCPECQRPLPESNQTYWRRKIQRNIERDRKHNEVLAEKGWYVLRIWEHELKANANLDPVLQKVKSFLTRVQNTSRKNMMLTVEQNQTVEELCQAVLVWLEIAGKAKSTLAGAVVVIDKLRETAPLTQLSVFTANGQLVGGRGRAMRDALARYGEKRDFLADGVTTRSTLKFQQLVEAINWGQGIAGWSSEARAIAVEKMVEIILNEIDAYFRREHINLKLDRNESPVAWIEQLFEIAKDRSQGRVEQHLVGAKLKRRLPDSEVTVHAAFAADVQTHRAGDIVINNIVFHITASPAPPVIRKCQDNLRLNQHPVLVVPRDAVERAKGMASAVEGVPGLERRISFVAIEDFLASNIIELAGAEGTSFIEVMDSILDIYNQRIETSETDLSLRIVLK